MLTYKRRKRASAIKRIRAKFGRDTQYEVLVFCSRRNLYVQLFDLCAKKTRFTLSTCDEKDKKNHRNISTAQQLGVKLADRCRTDGINNVSFNRAEKTFHGVVKAIASGFYSN